MNLQQKLDAARALHAQGYNCAQSVLLANADDLGIDPSQAAAYSMGFGGGVGGQGEICGVVSALAIAVGILDGGTPDCKARAYATVRKLSDEFLARNGHLRCRDLKCPPQRKSCDLLIADGVEILHNYIQQRKEPLAK